MVARRTFGGKVRYRVSLYITGNNSVERKKKFSREKLMVQLVEDMPTGAKPLKREKR